MGMYRMLMACLASSMQEAGPKNKAKLPGFKFPHGSLLVPLKFKSVSKAENQTNTTRAGNGAVFLRSQSSSDYPHGRFWKCCYEGQPPVLGASLNHCFALCSVERSKPYCKELLTPRTREHICEIDVYR